MEEPCHKYVQKLKKLKCKKHPKNCITFVNVSKCTTFSSRFMCQICIMELVSNSQIKRLNYDDKIISIDELETEDIKNIPNWPPLPNTLQINNKIVTEVEEYQQDNQQNQMKEDIKTYFEEIRSQVNEKIDQLEKNMHIKLDNQLQDQKEIIPLIEQEIQTSFDFQKLQETFNTYLNNQQNQEEENNNNLQDEDCLNDYLQNSYSSYMNNDRLRNYLNLFKQNQILDIWDVQNQLQKFEPKENLTNILLNNFKFIQIGQLSKNLFPFEQIRNHRGSTSLFNPIQGDLTEQVKFKANINEYESISVVYTKPFDIEQQINLRLGIKSCQNFVLDGDTKFVIGLVQDKDLQKFTQDIIGLQFQSNTEKNNQKLKKEEKIQQEVQGEIKEEEENTITNNNNNNNKNMFSIFNGPNVYCKKRDQEGTGARKYDTQVRYIDSVLKEVNKNDERIRIGGGQLKQQLQKQPHLEQRNIRTLQETDRISQNNSTNNQVNDLNIFRNLNNNLDQQQQQNTNSNTNNNNCSNTSSFFQQLQQKQSNDKENPFATTTTNSNSNQGAQQQQQDKKCDFLSQIQSTISKPQEENQTENPFDLGKNKNNSDSNEQQNQVQLEIPNFEFIDQQISRQIQLANQSDLNSEEQEAVIRSNTHSSSRSRSGLSRSRITYSDEDDDDDDDEYDDEDRNYSLEEDYEDDDDDDDDDEEDDDYQEEEESEQEEEEAKVDNNNENLNRVNNDNSTTNNNVNNGLQQINLENNNLSQNNDNDTNQQPSNQQQSSSSFNIFQTNNNSGNNKMVNIFANYNFTNNNNNEVSQNNNEMNNKKLSLNEDITVMNPQVLDLFQKNPEQQFSGNIFKYTKEIKLHEKNSPQICTYDTQQQQFGDIFEDGLKLYVQVCVKKQRFIVEDQKQSLKIKNVELFQNINLQEKWRIFIFMQDLKNDVTFYPKQFKVENAH